MTCVTSIVLSGYEQDVLSLKYETIVNGGYAVALFF